MDRLIELLKTNARLSNSELAVMLAKTEQEVAQDIQKLEDDGIIKGYTAIVDESAYDPNSVFALIELKVTPQSQSGFDEIARQISEYDQVEAVRLMSGTYDIIVEVTGKNIRDISLFVSQRLAAIDAVQETTTHFGLRVYKDNGIIIGKANEERSFIENFVEEISEISENKTVCTVSISCNTLLNNLDRVKKNKLSVIPSDGWILTAVNAGFNDGESVFDVTKRVCMENKIPFEFTLAPIYNTAYIEGINNIYEFDCGSTSGWLYKVNGEFKSYGCSDCKLNNGDIIEWVYTCDLGKDVGNEYKE